MYTQRKVVSDGDIRLECLSGWGERNGFVVDEGARSVDGVSRAVGKWGVDYTGGTAKDTFVLKYLIVKEFVNITLSMSLV